MFFAVIPAGALYKRLRARRAEQQKMGKAAEAKFRQRARARADPMAAGQRARAAEAWPSQPCAMFAASRVARALSRPALQPE